MRSTKCGFLELAGASSPAERLAQFGPTLLAHIGFDAAYDPAQTAMPAVLGNEVVHALVDTGATESCIDSQLAAQLNLPVVDRRAVSGVHGANDVNMHLAQVYVPALNFTIHGMFAGVHLLAGGQIHSALIGRTFLRSFRMIYDGHTGNVDLVFAEDLSPS